MNFFNISRVRRSLLSAIFVPVAAVALTAGVGAVADAAPAAAGPTKIDLQGAVNVRDLGGYWTYDGAKVKSGKVIRADALGKLTDADVQKLGGLKLQTVVDLRTNAEVQGLGADKLPAGVPLVARPIDDTGMFVKMSQAIQSRDPQQQQALLGDGKAEQIMGDVYRSFFTADSLSKFGQTVRDLANTGNATLYHCTAGKDRTGWLSYVTLRAVGVPESVARQDYLLSNRYRAAADAATRAQLKQAGYMRNPDLLIPLQEVRDDYLDIAVDQVNSQFGDFGKFLTQGLGLDAGTILKLRKNLVG
ncbi:tyrosine-protein phosphatase [Nocardia sp. NBC_01503]|uniref:tyrosine-protein phosphatase n=1 Tax=Nocardia sp. NBC_01503 TaxID=2975997 RepID=UPI002E7BF0B5|nr:tyrosine-protein phosphatase [Nocardia sp. NBC_01503]WTL29654.1 tyrosine-protein phosphatase [Nocardia sp. NBC_01503]